MASAMVKKKDPPKPAVSEAEMTERNGAADWDDDDEENSKSTTNTPLLGR